MEFVDTIAAIIQWAALPLTYLALLLLFLIFVVRPFFAYLFNPERFKTMRLLEEARKHQEKHKQEPQEDMLEEDAGEELLPDNMQDRKKKIAKLAESDPEKAGQLVKQWLKKDE